MNDLPKTLEMLADKLGVATTSLLKVYAAQAHVEGIKDAVWAALWLAIAVITLSLALSYWSRLHEREHTLGPILSFVAAFLMFLISAGCGTDSFTEFSNPQYWAIHKLVADIKR